MVCRSVRSGAKVSQEVVKYLGVAHSDEQKKALLRLAQTEINNEIALPLPKTMNNHCPGAFLGNMVEIARPVEGMHEIFGAMIDKIHLKSLFKPYEYERLKDLIIGRIAQPDSKRQTAKFMTEDYLKPLYYK